MLSSGGSNWIMEDDGMKVAIKSMKDMFCEILKTYSLVEIMAIGATRILFREDAGQKIIQFISDGRPEQ